MQAPPLTDYTRPDGLNKYGADEWDRVITILKESGVVSKLDTSALFALCNEWGKYMEAEEKLRTMGRVFKAPGSGYPMMNPYETISGHSYKRYKEMAVQFGMTPASRSKVSASGEGAKQMHPFEAAVDGVPMKAVK
jgi:P27 family predicted phage terminase small subunit